jgi:hypothetical protein
VPSPSSIRTRIDAALTRVGGNQVRTAYLRTQVVTGDITTGREVVVPTDTAITPKPIYRQLNESMVLTNGKLAEAGDYRFLISANFTTIDVLKNIRTQLVLKGTDGSVEVLRIFHVKAPAIGSATEEPSAILFTVFARSLSHA